MYLRLLMGIVAFLLAASQVFAGPATGKPLEKFVEQISRKTGMDEQAVREHAAEALRRSGKFSTADLERIRTGEKADFSPTRQNEMVRLLQNNHGFRVATRFEAVRLSKVTDEVRALMIEQAKKNAYDELKTAFDANAIAHLRHQTAQIKLSLLRRKSAVTAEIAKAEKELSEANKLWIATAFDMDFVLSNFFAVHGIGYSRLGSDGELFTLDRKLSTDEGWAKVQKAIGANDSRARKYVFDTENPQSAGIYDSARNVMYLGFDFIRSVSSY